MAIANSQPLSDPNSPSLLQARALAINEQLLISAVRQHELIETSEALNEQLKKQSEERFRAIAMASAEAIYRMSPDWSEMRLMAGKNFLESLDEPSTTWLADHVPEEDQPELAAGIEEAIRSKSNFEMEHRILRVDGKIGWICSRAVPILDEKGEIIEWFGTANDVTERKEGEQKLSELSQALERRAGQLQEQTTQLRDLAEEMGLIEQKERQRLASLLHDELQQLLVAARMQLGTATELMKEDEARGAVELASRWIKEATSASRDLTRQLRPPALYEEGLLAALHWLASEMAERHHLRVEIHGQEAGKPLSEGLKALLFDSIRELLFNTVKHAEVDEASVSVQEEANCLRVVVEDHGKGFEGEEAASENARWGFGLFSLRDRLTAYGGSISVVSNLGNGTRVTFEAPLFDSSAHL